ncbi:hypothetical protein [Kitasatospora sp. NPDC087314]|uniref:hypothetical protein n=1 Tax=Kitasatospora sp. NPDC087314 TaxID=3364068 RepID=UPI0037FD7A47
MDNNAEPLGAWQGLSLAADTPAAPDRHILRALHATMFGRRCFAQIEATELAALADLPDAAVVLGSRRGYLADSPENRALAALLRERPEEFGLVGGPIVLGAQSLHLGPDRSGGAGWLGLAGLQCYEGFQRLVVIAHVARELSPAELAKAVLWVVVVTGDERQRIRELCDEAAHYVNSPVPQDNLSRCQYLLAVQAEFRKEGSYFDPRRGIVAGPHPVGFTPADVFRSLAALAPHPHLSNQLQVEKGLDELWSDITSPSYRSLVHADLHAISVQRAVEARQETQKAIARILRRHNTGCYKLLEYAPELVTWTACRMLPLETLHDGSRKSPRWMDRIRGDLPAETERVAHRLVASYARLRGSNHKFKFVAPELGLWLELVDDIGRA